MTPPELRICLVGFGSIARTHASALAALPSVRALPFRPVLAAIVSDRPADVAADAALLGARVLTLDEALADAGLDVFDVTTRNVRHLDQAGAILRAGQPPLPGEADRTDTRGGRRPGRPWPLPRRRRHRSGW